MKANRLFTLLIIAALFAVTGLTVREAVATSAVLFNVDSATRSYSAWAEAVESRASAVDSATRSYMDWAEAVEASPMTVDSATRSYIAWARSAELGNTHIPVTGEVSCNHYAIPANVNSATRSYIAWAESVSCR